MMARMLFMLLAIATTAADDFTLDTTANLMADKHVYRHAHLKHTKILDLDPTPGALSPHQLAQLLEKHASAREVEMGGAMGDPPIPDAYYGFIPEHVGEILPGGGPLSWSAPCFKESTAELSGPASVGAPLTITLNLEKPTGLTCEDHYLFLTVSSWHHDSYLVHGKHTVEWHNLDALELEDVASSGIRVYRFRTAMPTVIADIYETAKLFIDADKKGVPGVPDAAAKSNLKFLQDYANFSYPPRSDSSASTVLGPDSNVTIASGDLLGIIRLDGLDPLIAWGTGSRLGHTTMALEIRGEMYVVESQAKSNYWPKNFVQRTPLAEWLTTAHAADYNVVLLPLSEENREKFDVNACLKWFEASAEGLLYGYPTLLSGWVDTADNNLPLIAGGGTHNLLATAFALLDPLLMKFVYKPTATDPSKFPSLPNIWSLTMAQRAGMPNITASTTVAEAYAYAASVNISLSELFALPEQDSWEYPAGPGYRAGKAMVCDVFVCNAWRAGGVLTNDINCGEFTPFDLYEMKIFSDKPRSELPAACLTADPESENPYCQLMGKYRVDLTEQYNSVVPFDHMRENCPSQAPDYAARFSAHAKATC
eukprot:TRINITY_DN18619_c0_g1_i1.p1 TRINITY_DN18619_c0_g1~~TRINITY_DN18619_c0_g1_i1.p1  ORF type:complete len:595 (-),score=141.36 TRINITY_DN18619_c0_g1_i1:141-1925(-)